MTLKEMNKWKFMKLITPPPKKIASLHMQNACDEASINYVTTLYYHKSKT